MFFHGPTSWLKLKTSQWFFPVVSFGIFILMGSIGLMAVPLKVPTDGKTHLSFIDALFMATSAACVTGLSVIDIGSYFSFLGQLIILILIQIGGLGIMTISTGLLTLTGRSISIRSRFILQDTFTHSPQSDILSMIKRIVAFTLVIEASGAITLFLGFFSHHGDLSRSLWEAIFHSISAFCNAGFSLFSDSLMGYRADPNVVLTISTLIVMGGLGFLVLNELYGQLRFILSPKRLWHRLSLHSKIVLSTTFWLIVSGLLLFLILEWNVTMKDFSLSERILASLFQSVTPRTAGFNTLDFASMTPITIMGTMILMFIGGSPGSTAGGIKTSTTAALVAFGISRFLGKERASIFRRSIDEDSINKAFGVLSLGILIVISSTACLLVTELGAKPYGETGGLFVKYLFEVISAFGTVGLSMGVTSELNDLSKLVLVFVMFIGRLGPLVIASAISPRPYPKSSFIYAEEKIMIG
ncbi:MAG: TrkH family potassium uptake protein [Syntrophobacterales bacterium]|nr:TrkH family potassium uptake protein [Syntrophobacterales bacterium]